MIDDIKPYPAYKDSGVPWFGRIPEHWQLPRLGAVLEERRETNEDGHVTSVLSVMKDIGVIPYEEKGNIGNKKSDDISRYKIVRPDDVVANSMNVIIGSVGISRFTGCLSPVYYVLRRRDLNDNPRYLNAVFQTKSFQHCLTRIGNGILAHRMRIPMELLKCEPFLKPPADEQSAIVRFLDHADRRIRRFIGAKRRLIGLLNEQKQVIIHCAVTHGLCPRVRLKPSGINWLGDIPEHWSTTKLKNVSTVQTGITLGKNYGSVKLDDRPYLRVANVQAGRLNLKTIKRIQLPASDIARSSLRYGDVLMTEGGDIDKLGRGCVWRNEIEGCLHQNHVFAVRPNQTRLLPDYLVLILGSQQGRRYFEITAKQTTNLASTNSTTLGSLPLFLPDVTEQQEILDALSLETRALEGPINRAELEIDFLREYRTSLVAGVVTGKLDVREAASRLPVVAEERNEFGTNLFSDDDQALDEVDLDAVPEETEA